MSLTENSASFPPGPGPRDVIAPPPGPTESVHEKLLQQMRQILMPVLTNCGERLARLGFTVQKLNRMGSLASFAVRHEASSIRAWLYFQIHTTSTRPPHGDPVIWSFVVNRGDEGLKAVPGRLARLDDPESLHSVIERFEAAALSAVHHQRPAD